VLVGVGRGGMVVEGGGGMVVEGGWEAWLLKVGGRHGC